jgi:hypothetical protein
MNTIILNGSPKLNPAESNTRIIAEAFIRNMENPIEIKRIAKESTEVLAKYVKNFDTIILIMPLYIHAMPGIVMKFIESLEPADKEGKSIGFIIQAGFMETAQERFVERYFENLSRQLNYKYLGTVSKGEAAAIYMYPKMFKKVLKLFSELGVEFEKSQSFDKDMVKKISTPYEIPKSTLRLLRLVNKLGLANIGWNNELKKNNAYNKRLARPFE